MRTEEDRFTLWPLLFGIAALFLGGWPGSYLFTSVWPLILFLLLVISVLIAVIVAFAIIVRSAWLRNWRKSASWMMLLVVAAAAIAAPDAVFGPFGRIGDHLHVLANKSSYEAELAALPSESHLRVFDWGGWAGINTFLIYDGTDQIAFPRGYRESGNLFDQCAGHVVHITGHYYRCNTP
jgi:hypothetical protein